MPPTAPSASITNNEVETSISFNIRFAKNNGVILSVSGSNPERQWYSDDLVFTSLDDALVHIRNVAATPANNPV